MNFLISAIIILSILHILKKKQIMVASRLFAFLLMCTFTYMYNEMPSLDDSPFNNSYALVTVALISYTAILFPDFVSYHTSGLFPELNSKLASQATYIVAWAGLLCTFFFLFILWYSDIS